MTDIRKLTTDYVTAFHTRDLVKVAEYLADDFTLTDPEVTSLTPKSNVLDYINALFDTHENLSFEAHSILIDDGASAIHFTLKLGEEIFDGVDVIHWEAGKMTSMHAYLTSRK